MAKSKLPKPQVVQRPVKAPSREEEPKFRLRPRSPRTGRGDMGWSVALRSIFRYAKDSARSRNAASARSGVHVQSRRSFSQRCAVRVTYSQNKTPGQWRAHGIYIERESAAGEKGRGGCGNDETVKDVGGTLSHWQASGDERTWKVILSPEFGDRVDLERMARDVIQRSEKELGTKLNWLAVSHFNTEHPHVHVVIRGRREDGTPLNLTRDFIKQGMRSLAENACTLQLGPRTELDAQEATEGEINQQRYTSLDRALERRGAREKGDSKHLHVSIDHGLLNNSSKAGFHERHLRARLIALEKMGLADQLNGGDWQVRSDLPAVLRAMQLASDRQKMLASKGVLLSDERLRLNVLDFRKTPEVQGRVLVHGEEQQRDGANRHYLLLEGTDAQVHMIFYTAEMEEARSRGKLKPNNFVRLQKRFVAGGQPTLKIEDFGAADSILKSKAFLGRAAEALITRGIIPGEEGWGGWLGRYQAAVRAAALESRNRGKNYINER